MFETCDLHSNVILAAFWKDIAGAAALLNVPGSKYSRLASEDPDFFYRCHCTDPIGTGYLHHSAVPCQSRNSSDCCCHLCCLFIFVNIGKLFIMERGKGSGTKDFHNL